MDREPAAPQIDASWVRPFAPPRASTPAGYAWLVDRYRLDVLPHWRWTFIGAKHVHQELHRDGGLYVVLPPPRDPGDDDVAQLLFALRNDGVSVAICRALFRAVDLDPLAAALTRAVQATPTGAYVRRLWYLFEELTGRRLPLEDVHQGNYVPLLDPDTHVTGRVRKHRRQRIDVNLLGTVGFAPTIRRTEVVRGISGERLRSRIDHLVSSYDDRTLRRAISWLYTRETMASFEIEHERPASTRAERFVALLREAPRIRMLTSAELLRLQNALVDTRFADTGWRPDQNYVGEAIDLARQRIHFVSPRPEDLAELMDGYLAATGIVLRSQRLEPVLAAAVISFAFVLLHPFTDGNGRIHRWLLHWVLSRRGVTPDELVIPVSAVMLSMRREYDAALETFSVPLLLHVRYTLDGEGRMTVLGETADLYRHPDLTDMAEGLWRWLTVAVDEELPGQLDFLVALDRARRQILEIVDMPDRLVVLFIKLCRQNGGELSRTKRESHFPMLTDVEVQRMEEVVRDEFPA